jgi:DNA-binding NarL/FixJ family response regulator
VRELASERKFSVRQTPIATGNAVRYPFDVSKKRPQAARLLSKREPAYWRTRLFKNVFSSKGKTVELGHWSVKIQMFGKRKTFSLISRNRIHAANEACEIYQTLADQGWEALNHRHDRHLPLREAALLSPSSIYHDVEYWKRRLIRRRYPEPRDPKALPPFSVRIEHAHTSHYFPLGTNDQTEAAALALRIYRTVATRGWAEAVTIHPRELSVAVRWQDNPLAWTYTTIHTRPGNDSAEFIKNQNANCSILLVEPDAGTRAALAVCSGSQDGFQCVAAFESIGEAFREKNQPPANIALINLTALSDEHSAARLEEIQRSQPGLVVLWYSLFSDADLLFKSTPGGAAVYMLKRTLAERIFDPIAKPAAVINSEWVASRVRNYFQKLSALLPAGPADVNLAKLTPREQEVLELLAKGDLIKEIATALDISNWTVHGYMKSIFGKLGVHNRTEAVVKYLQR